MGASRFFALSILGLCVSVFPHSAEADWTKRIADGRASAISPDGRFISVGHYLYDRDGNRVSAVDGFVGNVSLGGRFVSFYSEARNLVPSATNRRGDTFLLDRQTGSLRRVSVTDSEVQAIGGDSSPLDISADGGLVLFDTTATNFYSGDIPNTPDLFLRDWKRGKTEKVIVSFDGSPLHYPGGCCDQFHVGELSSDGRFVAFSSYANNVVRNDSNSRSDVFLRDRFLATSERVSVDSSGNQIEGLNSFSPSVSGDGRFVAFEVRGTSFPSRSDVFLRDRLLGATERINVNVRGAPSDRGVEDAISVSADGRFVAFASDATDIVPGVSGIRTSIFIRDRLTKTTKRVSVRVTDSPTNNLYPKLSANGRFLAFTIEPSATYIHDAGLLPDGRDDLVVDFGSRGLWQLVNRARWSKIHNASPDVIAVGDLDGDMKDDVIAGFGSRGLLVRYNNAGEWRTIRDSAPSRLVSADFDGNGTDDLAADFGADGLWVRLNDGAWRKVHAHSSQGLRTGDLNGDGADELIADLGASGLFARYGETWVRLPNASPIRMVTGDLDSEGDADLVAEARNGLVVRYNNRNPFVGLSNVRTKGLAAGDLDGDDHEDLLARIGNSGLWALYNRTAPWVKLDSRAANTFIAADLDQNGKKEVIAAFGNAGVFVRTNNSGPFRLLRAWPAQTISSANLN